MHDEGLGFHGSFRVAASDESRPVDRAGNGRVSPDEEGLIVGLNECKLSNESGRSP